MKIRVRATAVGPIALVLAALHAAACVGDAPRAGSDERPGSPDASNDSAAGGSDDGSASNGAADGGVRKLCPVGCVPLPPQGWVGPSAVAEQPGVANAQTCPPPYPQLEVVGRELGEDRYACTCASDRTCSMSLALHSAPSCQPGHAQQRYTPPECVSMAGYGSVVQLEPLVDTGSCSPQETRTGAELVRATVTACGQSTHASCADRDDCAGAPSPSPFTRLCIHRAGEVDCPNDDYSKRQVVYRNVGDGRTCACEKTGTCGEVALYDGTDCQGPAFKANECKTGAPWLSAKASVLPTVGCQPAISGALTREGVETICCNK